MKVDPFRVDEADFSSSVNQCMKVLAGPICKGGHYFHLKFGAFGNASVRLCTMFSKERA